MLGMYKKTLSQARHRCFAAALSVVVMLAALMFQDAASAADNGSIGAGATILTGKVVTTVTRLCLLTLLWTRCWSSLAKPLPRVPR